MEKYILCFDSVGKTSLELAGLLNNSEIKIITAQDLKTGIIKGNDFAEKLNLIVWSIYFEETSIFNDIIKFKSINKFKNVPLLIISNISRNDFVLKSVQSGANDFIVRPYNNLFLKRKIKELLNINTETNFTNLNNIESTINFTVKEILSIHLKGASRAKYDISMIMLSLGQSKNSNDDKQEKIIGKMQKIIDKDARETDIIMKYDKNSIISILPYTDEDGVKVFYNKIIKILSESNVLKKEAKGAIILASYESLTREGLKSSEDVIVKKLQSKLKVCMAIPT